MGLFLDCVGCPKGSVEYSNRLKEKCCLQFIGFAIAERLEEGTGLGGAMGSFVFNMS